MTKEAEADSVVIERLKRELENAKSDVKFALQREESTEQQVKEAKAQVAAYAEIIKQMIASSNEAAGKVAEQLARYIHR